jgi:hypothetical protein
MGADFFETFWVVVETSTLVYDDFARAYANANDVWCAIKFLILSAHEDKKKENVMLGYYEEEPP